MSPARPDALDRFVRALEAGWRETGGEESALLPRVEALMRELVASDDWLDPARARPHPQYYQQHLLHLDPRSASRWSASSGGRGSRRRSTTTRCGA
jgi:predicted metal-dependent enzyme (double-stranded beta helix superfamily)